MALDAAKFVIIGAGLAGMATAYRLALRGETRVVVLEKEQFPGMHSSGRNAAMIRQVVGDRDILKLASMGAEFFNGRAKGWQAPPPFRRNGSLLVASGKAWQKLLADASAARKEGVEFQQWDPVQIEESVPCTRGGRFDGGIFCPGDGVTDTDGLINGYYQAAKARGVALLTECEVGAIAIEKGRVKGVETSRGFIRGGTVVNAGGPWASKVAGLAGALKIEFTPLRRHLYYTGPLDWAREDWPYVWDIANEVYFRPESAGLLLSPCDESPARPAIPNVDPAVEETLAAKLAISFPGLLEVPVARAWAGLRTFAPDRKFVIGWDPIVKGFYWVAGLGGHGVTTSPAVGELAADELCAGAGKSGSPFSPSRFL